MHAYVEPDQQLRDAAAEELASIEVTFRILASVGELETHLQQHPDTMLVIFGTSADLDEALAFAAYQRVHRPVLGVVLLRAKVTTGVLHQSLRAGVREIVRGDDPAAVRAACARSVDVSKALSANVRLPVPGDGKAKVITVFAGKGGCGKSVVATNLAVALAAGGSRRVLLMDLDLQFGDVAIMLKLTPTRSIADAVPMAGRLDDSGLRSLITHYRPGVDTLLAPASPAEADRVDRELVTEIITSARELYDYVVVDSPPFVTDHVLAALDLSDWYILIVTPDLPTLKSVRLTVEMFDMLDYSKDRRLVLFNRSNSEVGLTLADVEEAVGAPLSTHMPSSRDVPTSVNAGTPIVIDHPTHPVSAAIRDLADRCSGVEREAEKPRRGLLSFARRGGR